MSEMNDDLVKAFLADPVNGRLVLSASFANFIKFFHWHIYHQQFIFKPFHSKIIRKIEDIAFGRNKRRNLIINVPPRFGKLLSNDTPVLTDRGWVSHGDLSVGDRVIGLDGGFKRVLAVSEEHPANCCVEFSDGEKIYCHENHEWVIDGRPHLGRIVRETKWLFSHSLSSGQEGKRGHRYNYQVPFMNGITGDNKDLPVKPYSFGAWLGDGSNTKPCITGDKLDYPIIERIVRDGYINHKTFIHKTTGVYSYHFSNLIPDLHKLGLCYWRKRVEKFIPDEYLTSSEEQRLELLAGLLDTDGHLSRGENRYHFTTSEEKLKDSFCQLISTFGWRVSVIRQEPRLSSSGIQGKKPYWIIGFNPDREIPCQLERKQLKKFSHKRKVAFKSVTYGDWGKVGKCIQVEDGVYLAGHTLKPTHNSAIVKYACAWSYMLNPHSNNIYTSYSDDLANAFSKDIRDIVDSPAFRTFTRLEFKKGKTGADYWETSEGGGFRAAPMGGALTGFGFGVTGDDFGGFGILDDPNKASSVKSQAEMNNVLDYYTNTFKSRANNQAKSPILLIMQRIGLDDLTGYVLENEADDWDIIKIPALDEETGVALWEEKFPAKELLKLKAQVPHVYYGQYQQEPIVVGGSVYKTEWFKYYNTSEDYVYQMSYFTADTAQKKGEANDFTVLQYWAKTIDNRLHLIDQIRGKFDADELRQQIVLFWEKWRMGAGNPKCPPYGFYIEDKSSGIGVLQEIKKNYPIPVIPIARARYKDEQGLWKSQDKFSRAMTAIPYIANGWVYLPNSEKDDISASILAEASAFKADLSHKKDDQIDPMNDAIDIAFGTAGISSVFI